MDGPAAPRKRPWELHAIACTFLIAVGASIALGILNPDNPKLEHLVATAGMTFTLIGLFRGSRVAWWASTAAFAFMTVVMIVESLGLVSRYGFIAHRRLFLSYAETAVCLATFGLLLSLKLRGALPPRAAPLVEDLPAFHAVLKVLAPLIFVLAALFSMATPLLFNAGRSSSERYSSSSLKTLASAEADFRANDRDWNHINDFWTGDVAGLYGIVPPKISDQDREFYRGYGLPDYDGKTPVKLIELSTALADGYPIPDLYPSVNGLYGSPSPKGGAWFVALRADRSVSPPEPYGVRNTSRFGFIAYSDDHIGGLRWAFIINENNTMFRQHVDRDLRPSRKWPPGPPAEEAFRDWPNDDELKARWSKLD